MYSRIRPWLFRLDPERAHAATLLDKFRHQVVQTPARLGVEPGEQVHVDVAENQSASHGANSSRSSQLL